MNTRNFKCFQAVYEERNLQVAANKLFLSPQGLSRIIKSLEEEVGTPLFVRNKSAGTRARKVLQDIKKTCQEIRVSIQGAKKEEEKSNLPPEN